MPDCEPRQVLAAIAAEARGRDEFRLMEVCGTHTVALFRTGVRSLLPPAVRLTSGPGCPVCVTPQGYIDAACAAARLPGVTVCTYGDMVRVPGRGGSLAEERARGGHVVVVYSAADALRYACRHPATTVVFLAVGFETTAPATALVLRQARADGVANLLVLAGHKLLLPAMRALLSPGNAAIDGFLCPGHVSVVIGAQAYEGLAAEFAKPCVIAGFEAGQMLAGILHLVRQVAQGVARVENVYGVAVTAEGNRLARCCLEDAFEPAAAAWRGLGTIPGSGLALRPEYSRFDAALRLGLDLADDGEAPGCRCGDVICGRIAPRDCPRFGVTCTPARPAGPCMVSSEGTCAAYARYGRQ